MLQSLPNEILYQILDQLKNIREMMLIDIRLCDRVVSYCILNVYYYFVLKKKESRISILKTQNILKLYVNYNQSDWINIFTQNNFSKTVRYIKFSTDFNQNIDKLPNSITHLTF